MTGEAPRAVPRVNGRVQYGFALGWGWAICNHLPLSSRPRLAHAPVVASDSMGDRLLGRAGGA